MGKANSSRAVRRLVSQYMSTPWERLLEQPISGGHFVQLYQADESSLSKNVGHYIWEGLRRGDGVLLITTSDHHELFAGQLERMGADLPALQASRQLTFLDAEATMAQFMVGGQPDWERFESVIRAAIRNIRPAEGAEGLRAYGEMVGVLWKARQFAAAIRLEQLWNKLLEQHAFSLYCAYAIDVFGKDFGAANLNGVLCTHTHLVPAQPDGALEAALNLAIEDVLGQNASELRTQIKSNHHRGWAVMPAAEAMILSLRENMPEKADQVIQRARRHYRG
jgi:hypothetical protein